MEPERIAIKSSSCALRGALEQLAPIPLTTAPPRVEAPPAPAATAAAPGSAAKPAKIPLSWQKQLMSHLNRFKRYPDQARASGARGVTNIAFTIDRSGRVLSARVAQGSRSTMLDEEAVAIIQRASPMPTPPLDAPGETFDLVLPIQFHIH